MRMELQLPVQTDVRYATHPLIAATFSGVLLLSTCSSSNANATSISDRIPLYIIPVASSAPAYDTQDQCIYNIFCLQGHTLMCSSALCVNLSA